MSNPLSHGLGNMGSIREWMSRRQPPSICCFRTHSRTTDKAPRSDSRPPSRTSGDRALSERKWLSTGKWEISHQGYFQPPVPAAHLAGPEPRDGGGHRRPEPRACLDTGQLETDYSGKSAGWRGLGWGSELTLPKKGTEKVSSSTGKIQTSSM